MTDIEGTDSRTAFLENLRQRILPLRTRAVVRNDWLRQRLDTILPAVMAREGFDMWIIAAREYNEDPVIMTMLPEPRMVLASHRRAASRWRPASGTGTGGSQAARRGSPASRRR